MPGSPSAIAEARTRRATRSLLDRLPSSRPFERWLAASGEQAPDFAALPSRPDLWSPLAGAPWGSRRPAILAAWRHWLLGVMPPAPDDLVVHRGADGRFVLHTSGAAIAGQLVLPSGGEGSARPPVLLTPSGHMGWAAMALRRGWAACVVSACEGDDDSATLPWDGSAVAKRAWAMSRAVDALHAECAVDATRIVVAGHGPNGKAALVAAAFDERIASVVASSSGVLGATPARLCTDRHGGQGIELITRRHPDWFHPRLRFFAGREHLLPTDTHELLACIAPRPALISGAVGDPAASTFAAEQAIGAARAVYELFDARGALALQWRPGGHRETPEAIAGYLDWAAGAVEGATSAPAPGRHTGERLPWPADRVERARPARIGGRRVIATWLAAGTAGATPGIEWLGDDGTDRPVAVWLGPLARAAGWRAGSEHTVPMPRLLAQAGFAVACHDLAGTGARADEDADLRRLVADASAVLDATGPAWLAGYGAGALAGALLAAVDDRVLGSALVAPLTGEPLLDERPPFTFADVLSALANRPALLATPLIDPSCEPATYARAAAEAGVDHLVLDDHHRLSTETRFVVRAWLAHEALMARAGTRAA